MEDYSRPLSATTVSPTRVETEKGFERLLGIRQNSQQVGSQKKGLTQNLITYKHQGERHEAY